MERNYLKIGPAARFFDIEEEDLLSWLKDGLIPDECYFSFQGELRFAMPSLENFFLQHKGALGEPKPTNEKRDVGLAYVRSKDIIRVMHWIICRQDLYLRLLQKWLVSDWDDSETKIVEFAEHVRGIIEHYLEEGDAYGAIERFHHYCNKYECIDKKVMRVFESFLDLRDIYPLPPDDSLESILDAMSADGLRNDLPDFPFSHKSPSFPWPANGNWSDRN